MPTTMAPAPNARGVGAGARLPVPARDRRPALAALAVLLIFGGALTSGLIAFRSGERSDFLVLAHDVRPGQRLQATDLAVARIAGTGAKAVPASRRARVIGEYATTRGFAGTLLTSDMVEPRPAVPGGSAVVGLTLDASQAPAGGVALGDVVRVLLVPQRGTDGSSRVLVSAARVVGDGAARAASGGGVGSLPMSSNGTTVSVLVPQGQAAAVAAASAQRQAAVIQLPPSTKPAIG